MEGEGLHFPLAGDGELDLGVGLAAHALDGVVEGHVGDGFAVDLRDDVADLQSGRVAGTDNAVCRLDFLQTDDQNALDIHLDTDRLPAGDQHTFTDDLHRLPRIAVMIDAKPDPADAKQHHAE